MALLALGGLRLALPDNLAVGPSWLLLAAVPVMLLPLVWTRWAGNHDWNQRLGYAVNGAVTLDMLWSLALLVHALPKHTESPGALLRSAAALWVANILVFASWYWRLDAGGPHERETRAAYVAGAFLFPQMTLNDDTRVAMDVKSWSPTFVDYLFLAFNTSTAFSPTDAPVLSRWAKVLMMTQASISFATVALLAARAVNIL